ncbi:hypothetical protein DRO59_02565 [Candidatus Bathyarchaeota archaeon]|nr:MAG: hypothetical protein DRO59_02565 [Candidatus Bathyarchaeota archaeon]
MSVEVKVLELERKVNILSKALYLILFEEAEAISKKEVEELKERLNAYVQGKKDEFVSLDEMLS